ncbi:GntR family transcriptional regulator [Marinomonas fungiae]|uniref:Pyruvate dehydrogenase complex repressor n=1 Tax=Marinomonas fungiae TaxID=1137284 RepID=A0A0K6IK93_9GAMM|nr:GntR family transcriptional regulator [Marinomonas fungiae]CUB03722.1 transcriptional regulator, GntR family [Marinomonas fungiae]
MNNRPFQRAKQTKVSDLIMQELESMILDGTFKAGQKLPPERELAERFEVSRPSLREALQKLAARGVVYSKHGGGTYVSEQIGSSFTDPLLELLSAHDEFLYDQLEFRDALEGLSAYYAALRATEADKAMLTKRYDALVEANLKEDASQESKLDTEFHMAIAECAHNVVLLHTLRGLCSTLEKSISANLTNLFDKPDARQHIMAHHKTLYEAIMAGKADEARAAVHTHLVFVEDNLLKIRHEESRIQRSLRRSENTMN